VGEAWLLFLAAAGSLAAGTPPGQFTGRPSVPSVHVAGGRSARLLGADAGGELGPGELLGPPPGAALAGTATNQATKLSTTAQIVPDRARRCDWGDIRAPRITGRLRRRGSRGSPAINGGEAGVTTLSETYAAPNRAVNGHMRTGRSLPGSPAALVSA